MESLPKKVQEPTRTFSIFSIGKGTIMSRTNGHSDVDSFIYPLFLFCPTSNYYGFAYMSLYVTHYLNKEVQMQLFLSCFIYANFHLLSILAPLEY